MTSSKADDSVGEVADQIPRRVTKGAGLICPGRTTASATVPLRCKDRW